MSVRQEKHDIVAKSLPLQWSFVINDAKHVDFKYGSASYIILQDMEKISKFCNRQYMQSLYVTM